MTRVQRNRHIFALGVLALVLGFFVIDTPVEFLLFMAFAFAYIGVVVNAPLREPARRRVRHDSFR